ncbi:transient receptor potential cation channel subfamily M member 2-like [Protopterus annectens]|uniref:transient receptor potential cation channel subfamily M member 2-like n=1 Tax=Protopterus annectens TaxID=7888 RepID=UPI001CFAF7D8|nr:transient receptor potential cation channel subfamily M member 2-like [Protopterus annectens]
MNRVTPDIQDGHTKKKKRIASAGLLAQTKSGMYYKINSQLTSSSDEKNYIRSWIQERIRKSECIYHKKKDETESGKQVCACGHEKEEHSFVAQNHGFHQDLPWDVTKHTKEVPTDAYGDLTFTGLTQNVSKYIRVSSKTPPEVLYKLMTECWRLKVPNLLISVTGGAKNFNMKPKLKDIFRRGLIKAAQSTGAWIITGGSHAGVMKHVGEAIRDYNMSSSPKEGKIVVIGIATWGTVYNRKSLISEEGMFPAEYKLDEENQGRLSCLNNNHSHFILVDDGTHGRYGVEIPLRTRLEKLISHQVMEDGGVGINIPIVCLVLEGGPGTLDTIFNAMLNGTPCVVIQGSGRVADVIANVANLPISQITIACIQKQLKIFFEEEFATFSDNKIIEWTKKIQDIVRQQQLLTIFRVEKHSNQDIDTVILHALLKAARCHDSLGRENWDHQLKLAVAWNRVDVARTMIFTDERQWKSSDLHDSMTTALVSDKPEFVKLFLDQAVNVKDYLNQKTLTNLYNNFSTSSQAYGMLVKQVKEESKYSESNLEICLRHVSCVLKNLLGDFIKPLYHTTKKGQINIAGIYIKAISLFSRRKHRHSPQPENILEEPTRDLFIWALLQNRKELANLMWEQSQDCIIAALAASKIMKELAKIEDDTDILEEMLSLANEYEEKAIGVLNECYRKDEEKAQKLLVRVSRCWGYTTCVRFAIEADNKKFIAQTGVQAFLTRVWFGEISVETRTWQLLMCILCLPLIYTNLISFRSDEQIRNTENEQNGDLSMVTTETVENNGNKSTVVTRSFSEAQLISVPDNEKLTALTCIQRMSAFFSAPVVIFYLNAVSYIGFLWLFAYVLMMDFQNLPSWTEYLLYVWVFSLVCEEIKQVAYNPTGSGVYKKAEIYISDLWNKMDLLGLTVFIVGLICRLIPATFYAGRVILSMDFIIFCVRLMYIFTVNKTLGPKLIIVTRMIKDIFFFLFLLAVWVVSFGVAKQAILIHNEKRLKWIFRDVIYMPYLTMFGQLPTDVDGNNFDATKCSQNGTDDTLPKCVENVSNTPIFPEWLTMILLCVYLLFINILLLNLLIAMFNYTFQLVQEQTDTIWKFQRFGLIEEYHGRSTLPPPFILLSHVVLIVKRLICCRPPTRYKRFKNELLKTEDDDLLIWETFMKDNYLASLHQNTKQSTDHQIKYMSKNVSRIAETLQIHHDSRGGTTEQRLVHLEEQVNQSSIALNWIINALVEKGFGSKNQAPSIAIKTNNVSAEADSSEVGDKDDTSQYHINARNLQYPDSNVYRFPVPDEKVPWEVEFKEYNPPFYPSQNLPVQSTVELPQPRIHSATARPAVNYNTVDGSVDRRSNYGPYKIQDGLPVNPFGRTGLKGQGHLYWFGPNISLDPVITRWKRGSDGVVLKKKQKKMLEFLSTKRSASEHSSLPGGVLFPGDTFPKRITQVLNAKLREAIAEKLKQGREVYKGYIDDGRNTDNAWVETTAINIHFDVDDDLMRQLNKACSQTASSETVLRWQLVDQNITIHESHKPILQKVSALHEAYY